MPEGGGRPIVWVTQQKGRYNIYLAGVMIFLQKIVYFHDDLRRKFIVLLAFASLLIVMREVF